MKRTPLTIIFTIVFIDLLGFGIIIPILPSYAQRGFGSSDLTVGFLVASFSLMQLLFTPLWGRISDRVGRKPVLIVGLICTIVGYVLFGMAGSLAMLFASRLLSGIGGANISAAQAYIADVTPQHERAKGMGLIGAAFGLGFVFGPFLGGVLSKYGYEIPGFAAASLSLIALLTTIFFLPEPKEHAGEELKEKFSLSNLSAALKKPRILLLLSLFFLATFGYANIYASFPMLSTRDLGYTDTQVGYLFGFLGLIGAATQGGFIRLLTGKYREPVLFIVGAFMTIFGLALIPFSPSTVALLAVLTVLALGSNIMMPTSLSMLSRNTDPREQGGILGINQSLGALGRTLGPVCGSFFFQSYGHSWPFLAGGIIMFFVFLLAWRLL